MLVTPANRSQALTNLSQHVAAFPPGPEKLEAFCRWLAELTEQVAEVAWLAIPPDATVEYIDAHLQQKAINVMTRAYELRVPSGLSDPAYDTHVDQAVVGAFFSRLEDIMGSGPKEDLWRRWWAAYQAETSAGSA